MDDSLNYAEYTVDKKAEGKNLHKRFLMIALYLLAIAAIVVLIAVTQGGAALLGGILFVLVVALIFFTWRLVKEERKYEVANAKLKIQEINGSGKAKVVFENLVSEFALIAPMTDEYKEKFEKADEFHDYRGNSKSKDSYFARLEKDGKSTVVCFEATNKMLKVMTFYNKRATVVTLMSH
ncbi:MAG: hypothetical protein E7672_00755 [Ruminococcaceae bacterium]|nr:hypothetical protein [Oscillospiraceae bacterium]